MVKYGYDTLGRLKTTRDGPTGVALETYGHDAIGNRTSLLRAGITDSYTYPSDSHRLSAIGATLRSYDAVGNTIAIGGTTREFIYNADDRMRQVKQNGAVKAGYRYNAKGERVAATYGDVGPAATYTLYDEAGHWIGDYDSSGAVLQQAVWMGDAPAGVLVGAGTAQSLKYVQPDHLGTPRTVIDPLRNVAIWTWDATSEAFGNSPPNQDPDLDGSLFVFNMRFAGQRHDPNTGLSYNYYRDYDPVAGRYIQSDPIGLKGGLSTYAYVGGNPLGTTDFFGLACPAGLKAAGQCFDASNYNPAQGNRSVISDQATDEVFLANGRRLDYSQDEENFATISKLGDWKRVLAPTRETAKGVSADFDVDSAVIKAICHSHPKSNRWESIPGYGDDATVKGGYPLYLVRNGVYGVLELDNGQFQYRVLKGALPFHDRSNIQQRLDGFQEALGK